MVGRVKGEKGELCDGKKIKGELAVSSAQRNTN
jgi:hypothetical protein